MSSIKHFVANSIMCQPTRYAKDNGDLNLINDYFAMQGWQPLTREQHTAIAAIIRHRNYFLQENEAYDHRTKKTSPLKQLSIYDFLDNDTANQTRKLTRYFTGDESRLQQCNSRIKDSVRGVDNEHILAVKVMLPLFVSEPQLKKIKINKDNISTMQTGFDDDLKEKTQTNLCDEVSK